MPTRYGLGICAAFRVGFTALRPPYKSESQNPAPEIVPSPLAGEERNEVHERRGAVGAGQFDAAVKKR